jgi:hypothetical protein
VAVVSAGTDELILLRLFEPPCSADITGDLEVDVDDLVAVIVAWGQSGVPADIDGSGAVEVNDLVAVIVNWGPCREPV